MKRSEMVNILLDEINEREYQDYQWAYEDAEKVLSILESKGMQPPKDKGSDKYFANQLGYKSAKEYILETGSDIPGCWETEDEEI